MSFLIGMYKKVKDGTNPAEIVAACLLATGAVVALTWWLQRRSANRPSRVIKRSLRAVDELERRIASYSA